MAVGKNKRLARGGKKGSKKKIVDPFQKKEWYDVKAPAVFTNTAIGKTLVTKTIGTKLATDGLKHRVYECNQGDLTNDEPSFRKFKLICEDTQGSDRNRECLTNFHGMTLTRDKISSMVKKWQTMIECHLECKTTDNYHLRIACIAFTKKMANQFAKTSYAQRDQIKRIRAKMRDIIISDVSDSDMKSVLTKLIPDSISKEIEKQCTRIYPLHDVHIKNVKVLKKPKFDVNKLLEMHVSSKPEKPGAPSKSGQKIERPGDHYEPPMVESV